VLFLSSAFIVLYHKFVADLNEERETIVQFKKIGLTAKECRRYMSVHLAIAFFLPIFIGGIPGLVIVSRMAIYRTMTRAEMIHAFGNVVMMYGIILLFVMFLYFALRKKFFREAKV